MKVLLINGSPNKKGSTFTALGFVAEELEKEGIETEICQIPREPIPGCVGCGSCRIGGRNRCTIDGDIVNELLEKSEQADAFVFGTPVYYAAPNGHLLSVLDRVFFSGSAVFTGKPGAAICAARRGGTTAALDVLQKYFIISGMPIAPSTYWPMIHGRVASDVLQDKEGIQSMQMVGRNLAWLLKCIEAGKKEGVTFPKLAEDEKVRTNFVR